MQKGQSMLQVSFIKANKDLAIKGLKKKHFKDIEIVDSIINNDELRKKLQSALDELQSKINASSRETGKLLAAGKKEEAEKNKQEVAILKNELEPFNKQLANLEKELNDQLVSLPNLPHESVPEGKTRPDAYRSMHRIKPKWLLFN